MSDRPDEIRLREKGRKLELHYPSGDSASLSAEYLRVESPSAEVQGHSPDQAVLQLDKENVTILSLRPVGHYAICPTFSDGHDSGIFTFEYLYELGLTQDSRWAAYQEAVRAHRATASPLPACGLNPMETPHD